MGVLWEAMGTYCPEQSGIIIGWNVQIYRKRQGKDWHGWIGTNRMGGMQEKPADTLGSAPIHSMRGRIDIINKI